MGVQAPIDLYIEPRKSLRIAFGGQSIIVRLPSGVDKERQRTLYKNAQRWIQEKATENPSLLNPYRLKDYDGSCMSVMNSEFKLFVSREERKNAKVKQKGARVFITLPHTISHREENNLCKKLLSKTFATTFKSEVQSEVFDLNERYFQKDINTVRLKYNKSNWGSCSSKSNINLSTRLLLVPKDVRAYVIIHELSHLTEMNHSRRFWNIVAKACPDYKYYEKWLNQNGPNIDF